MTKFETLFGIKESEIKNTCVLMPILPKSILSLFGIKNLSRGKIYSSGNAENLTLINTGVGASFAGDAALYLADSGCRNIILFGSCGLVKSSSNMAVGSLVSPIECCAMESFTSMLLKNNGFKTFYPDKAMLESFLNDNEGVQKVSCATLGSLKLEEESGDLFTEKNIQVVDMECSSIFAAGTHKHLKTIALFYISDIINEKPFYTELGPDEKLRLLSSIASGVKSICRFIK